MTCPVFWTNGCLAAYWVIHQSLIFQLLADALGIRNDVLDMRRSGQMYQDYLGTCALLGAGD
jgi:hypothetical protein